MVSSSARARAAALDSSEAGLWGFASLPALLTWGGLVVLLLIAPRALSGFWQSEYDIWPLAALGIGVSALCVLRAISALPGLSPGPIGAALLFFGAWSALSALVASYSHDAWLEVARLSSALAIFWVARSFDRFEHRLALMVAAAVGVIWTGVPAIFDFWVTRNPRQFGPAVHPNLFANLLAIATPLALGSALALAARARSQPSERAFNWSNIGAGAMLVALVLGLAALAVTSSKGGLLAVMIGLLVTIVAAVRARPAASRALARRLWPLLLLGVLGAGVLGARTVGPRLLEARGAQDNSTQFRLYTWRATFAMTRQAPLLGHGPGSFVTVFPRYALAGPTRTAHQSFLQMAAEHGVPALLAILVAAGLAWRAGARMLKRGDWALGAAGLGALAALGTHAALDAGWSATSIVILFACLLALLDPAVPTRFPAQSLPAPREAMSPGLVRRAGPARAGSPGLATAGEEVAPRALHLGWTALALALALVAYALQRAASGEDERSLALRALREGNPGLALLRARAGVEMAPGSARTHLVLGDALRANGLDGRSAYEEAVRLQPLRAGNWLRLAQARIALEPRNPQAIEAAFERALERDPLSTMLRLERAAWRSRAGRPSSEADLERVLALWDEPYGLVPALTEWINLDFARALARLGPRLRQDDPGRFEALRERALADIAAARVYLERNRAILAAVGGDASLEEGRDIDELEAALSS